MGSKKKERWTYAAGRRPYTVTVEEWERGGNIYVRIWSKREQKYRCRSLRHKDKQKAKDHADKLAVKLREGSQEILHGEVTLERIFRLYRKHRTPQKTEAVQKDDGRKTELFQRFFGRKKRPENISHAEWLRFIAQRRSGAIDARGKAVSDEEARRPVRDRTIEVDLSWLNAVFNWAANWKLGNGQYLLRENPVRGFEVPKEKNPRRPVASQDRFEAIKAKAEQVTMEVTWGEKPEEVRSYLPELLDIVNGTGRRISAVCQLRYQDLRLEHGPYGAIRWPADTDKMGKETLVPVSPGVRAAIDRVLKERPGIGAAYLFPSPTDRSKPLRYELASDWLREAEKLACLETQEGALWHAYRRKWATERKHLPDVDVAAAGGWSNPRTLVEIYQQPDQESMLKVVMEPAELREMKGK